MSEELQLPPAKDEYSDILGDLARLSRTLLLTFRLEVGELMLQRFFGGSGHAYRDKNPSKEAKYAEFARTCESELSDFGLSIHVLRQCILARIAWDGLPSEVREQLRFNHVVALASVGEPNDRARLAMDTTLQGWSVAQLKDAITRVNEHTYYDSDPGTPGTQPPPAMPTPDKGFQPGRLVSQLVKAGQDLQTWRQAWGTVDASKLRGPQRTRVLEAVAALKAEVAQLEVELAAGQE